MDGSPSAAGLGTATEGLETNRGGRGPGGFPRGGEPVGGPGPAGRLPSPAAAQASGRSTQTEGRATGPTPRVATAGTLYLRVLRGDLDQGADCPSNPAGIRYLLSPHPGGEAAQGMWFQLAKASPARLPAERGGHQGLARPALPGTEKKAVAEGRTILWADESGFYLLPFPAAHLGVGRPDPGNPPQVEPRAPERHQRCQHDWRTLPGGTGPLLQGADIISFLEQLLEEIKGRLLVIWDGSPVHRSRAVKEWLAQGAARRIQLEQLPGYAPELNPDEGVWRYLKRMELKNLVCADLEQLGREFWAAAERLLTLSQPKGRGAALLHQGSKLCLLTHSLVSNSRFFVQFCLLLPCFPSVRSPGCAGIAKAHRTAARLSFILSHGLRAASNPVALTTVSSGGSYVCRFLERRRF